MTATALDVAMPRVGLEVVLTYAASRTRPTEHVRAVVIVNLLGDPAYDDGSVDVRCIDDPADRTNEGHDWTLSTRDVAAGVVTWREA